jgi:hypothetical protein
MCADIHDGREQNAPSKGRIQMCETKNLQISQIQLAPHGRSIQMCQEATYAPQQTAPLFDHLVGAGQQRGWNGETKRRGGLEIDD